MINERLRPHSGYYNEVRPEILALVVGTPESVCEIGCGTGALLAELHRRGVKQLRGIELRSDVAQLARARGFIDEVYVGDVESDRLELEDDAFDLVVASHVLEHLVDPWRTVTRVAKWIRPGGRFIGAVPNVRHARVLLPLLVSGTWRYENSGILDGTHLRFFTRKTLVDLIESSGLRLEAVVPAIQGRKSSALDRFSLGLLRDFAAYALCFSAIRPLEATDTRRTRHAEEAQRDPQRVRSRAEG
jgi:2-polyprenyl-3-methyl-5-hydroxy-6-metoxy-1,4-benzoquinol methylase